MTVKVCHMTSAHNNRDIRILEKECVSLAKCSEYDTYLIAEGRNSDYKGVHIIGVGSRSGGRFSRIFSFSKKIYKAAVVLDADIYHFHDPELLLYAKKLKKKHKRVIFDSHEHYHAQIMEKKYIPKILRQIVAGIYGFIENRACKYIDGAIFPCEINGRHIFEDRVQRYEFINNYPIKEEFLCDLIKKDGAEPAVCCVGSLTPERGTEQLIDACGIADVKLILGGSFDSEEFEDRLKDRDGYKIVDYRGYCSRDEVVEIYREATIGASTILYVGQYPTVGNLPTKVYEYMMMGMPFIISDFTHCKAIVEKYECGITVNPNSPEEIAKAIKYLVRNPEIAQKMGENGRNAVESEFNWEAEEKKLYKLYEDILKS